MTTYGTVLFESTLPAWGATSASLVRRNTASVSIHAPRVGSDSLPRCHRRKARFQSTLPAWGATFAGLALLSDSDLFQSTLPAWGATRSPLKLEAFMLFQSTLPAWGATLPQMSWANRLAVSIHAPRVGSDRSASRRCPCSRSVSIHAPRVGSDPFQHRRLLL